MPKQVEFRDSVVEYLVIVQYASTGRKTYYLRNSGDGRRRIKLGSSQELTLDQARIKAIEVKNSAYQCGRITLSHVFAEYARSGECSGKRSVSRDRERYTKIVEPLLGNMSPQDIFLKDVLAVMASLNPGLKAGTKNRYLAMLRSIFRFAVDQGYCAKDPTRSLRLEREVRVKLYEVNDELLNGLSCAVAWLDERYPRTAHLVELLLLTGMRIGEALSLTWRDIDLSVRHITLRLTKSGKIRHVPISDECLDLLNRIADADFRLQSEAEEWLFPSEFSNSHMTRPVRPWKQACRAAGLPVSLRFHDLRHVFASACVKAGIPLYTVQGLLGHSTIRMTERYAALANEDLLAASELVSHSLSLRAGVAQ